VAGVEFGELRQAPGDLGERIPARQIPVLGLDQALHRGPAVFVLLDQFADDPAMLGLVFFRARSRNRISSSLPW